LYIENADHGFGLKGSKDELIRNILQWVEKNGE
jgi:hypothetical protein